MFPARRGNTTCLCVSVTQAPPAAPPSSRPPLLIRPSQSALLSVPRANGDALNHSTLQPSVPSAAEAHEVFQTQQLSFGFCRPLVVFTKFRWNLLEFCFFFLFNANFTVRWAVQRRVVLVVHTGLRPQVVSLHLSSQHYFDRICGATHRLVHRSCSEAALSLDFRSNN